MLTNDEYWSAIARWQNNNLSPAEKQKYKVAGFLCESAVRQEGDSLLPYNMPEREMPVQELSDEMLTLIGLVNLMLAGGSGAEA